MDSYTIDPSIVDDISVFASVLLKLHKSNVIQESAYRTICKQIADLIRCKDEEESKEMYRDLKLLYDKYSWWNMYKIYNKQSKNVRRKKSVLGKINTNKSRLSVMSY
jgi:ribosomal protein S20